MLSCLRYLLRLSFLDRALIMATAVEASPAEAPGLPDYLIDPNAVLKDNSATWRYGRAPDYSNTRNVYEQSKSSQFIMRLWKSPYKSVQRESYNLK
jgi:hypothetical protein